MLFALLLAACAQSPHAALHPVGADLYAEIPDVGATIAAYKTAPAIQLVGSDGAANIAALAKDLGFDLQAISASLLPIADPNRPDDRWWPWSAAKRASFSVSGLESSAEPTGLADATTLWMVCDFAALDAAEQAAKALSVMGARDPKPAGEITVAGATAPVLEIGSPFEAIAKQAWIARIGTRLVLGTGAARPEDFVARVGAPDGGLVGAWKAIGADAALGAASGVTVVEILSDFDDQPAFVRENAALSYAALFAAPFLGAKGRWRIDLRGDRFTTEGVYEPRGKSAAVLGAFGAAPIPASALGFVPPDAVGTWLTDVDTAKAEAAIDALLGGASAGEARIAPAAEGEPRMSAGLASSMAVSLLPFQSLMSPTPRIVMAVGLADQEKFQAGLDAWIARAKAAHPDLQVERKPYRKVPTITIGSAKDEAEGNAGGGSPMGASMIEPTRVTIAILADRVVLASAPSVARNEIKRLQDATDVAPHALTKQVARPADAFEVSTIDWGAFLSKVYDGLRGFAPMLAQNLEKPVDVEKLPTSAQLFAPFRPSTSWAQRVGTRIHVHAESSFGPETPLGIAAFGYLGMRAASKTGEKVAGAAPEKGIGEGPQKQAEDGSTKTGGNPPVDEARTTTLAALREVRTAIAVYRSQSGRAPQSTAKLLEKTDAFPDGFLKGGKVPNDGWGRALVYTPEPDGSAYTLHSTGADGVDQQGAGDDVRLP